MEHKYDELVGHLKKALELVSSLKLGEGLSKGKIGEVILANYLNHELIKGDKGGDGVDSEGFRYEYKISHDNQFNFNFGHSTKRKETIEELVNRHFEGVEGAFCALMDKGEPKKIVYCPISTLTPYLISHISKSTGKTYIKRFDPIEEFSELDQAKWILKTDFHVDSAPRRAAKQKKKKT
ncbi:hypothetical protein [Vibrio hyugaensis]|uniref:hypothetical protein n=1 Tax=Vibrio hyugaensis TaxID=1534743 RepID=UPI0005F00429|nr:hypothetical protein [Vibrio hyugaensis]